MAWKIEWSDEAIRDISQLEQSIAVRIVKKLDQTAKDPVRSFERQVGSDEYKLRIGDYRLLALLNHSNQTIFIGKVGHRKNIYKR